MAALADSDDGVSPSRQTDRAGSVMKESQYHSKQKQMLKARTIGKKVKSKAEIEAIDNQRRLQQDANKAEQAQKDL